MAMQTRGVRDRYHHRSDLRTPPRSKKGLHDPASSQKISSGAKSYTGQDSHFSIQKSITCSHCSIQMKSSSVPQLISTHGWRNLSMCPWGEKREISKQPALSTLLESWFLFPQQAWGWRAEAEVHLRAPRRSDIN